MKTLGLIVNPIAGMGGAVGLKGTDGEETLKRAVLLGAKPVAPARAGSFLTHMEQLKKKIRLLVGAGMMGQYEAQEIGFEYALVGETRDKTSAEDTKEVAAQMKRKGADLIVFCGGDGTARDVMDVVNTSVPALGVPTGVKMHSAVFSVNPESAAWVTVGFLCGRLPLREAEVMDVDEEAFRQGRLSATLCGYMLVPYEPQSVQGAKIASPLTESELRNQAAIAVYIIEEVLEPDVIYVLGPGTTTRTITDLLDEGKTLLGVDLLCGKKVIAQDVNEEGILDKIRGQKAKVIVTPIGGQGFIFGRGNQQISPSVIREVGRENIIVIATRQKLGALTSLRVDTGDQRVDQMLRGHIKVITDYKEERLMPLE